MTARLVAAALLLSTIAADEVPPALRAFAARRSNAFLGGAGDNPLADANGLFGGKLHSHLLHGLGLRSGLGSGSDASMEAPAFDIPTAFEAELTSTRRHLKANLADLLAKLSDDKDASQSPPSDIPLDNAAKDDTPSDNAVPSDDAAAPSDNAAAPSDNAAAPSDNAAAPSDNAAAPLDNAAAPLDNAAAPSDNAAAPSDNAAAPSDNAAAPLDNAVAPLYKAAKSSLDKLLSDAADNNEAAHDDSSNNGAAHDDGSNNGAAHDEGSDDVTGMDDDPQRDFMNMMGPLNATETHRKSLEIALGDPGNSDRWTVIQRDGVPSSQFSCGSATNKLYEVTAVQAASDVIFHDEGALVEDPDLDSDQWGLGQPWKRLWDADELEAEPLLALSNVTLNTVESAPFLRLYTEPEQDDGNLLLKYKEPLRVVYVCEGKGRATIRFSAQTAEGVDLCFSWVKSCDPSWSGLKIIQSGSGQSVWENGHIISDWQSNVDPLELSNTASFLLTHPGSEGVVRIARAEAVSSNEAMNVTIRGVVTDTSAVVSLGNDEAEQLDVVYSCEAHSIKSEVTLRLINESPAVPPIEIMWTARCSEADLSSVSATATSCSTKTGSQNLLQEATAFQAGVVDMKFSTDLLQIDAVDDCTAFTFTSSEPDATLSLFPNHQLIYDKRKLVVTNRVGTVETSLTGDSIIRVPYTCIDDGLVDLHMTVHLRDRPSIDLSWTKMCVKPTVHTEASLTGSALLGWLMAIFLSTFLVCFISRSRTLSSYLIRRAGDLICCLRYKTRFRGKMLESSTSAI